MQTEATTDPALSQRPSKFYGKHRGIVADNEDPDGMGRIKARVPEVLHGEVTGWALPCVPYAAEGSGQFTIPPEGAGVWIEFEGGEVSRPIWTGCWWGKGEVPEDTEGNSGSPGTKALRTEKGLMVTLDDDSETVRVADEKGNNLLEIATRGGTVTVEADTKVVVEASTIELVEGASHPVVFGDELMKHLGKMAAKYQAHTHPGQTVLGIPVTPAPPVPPLPTPTPSLVSKKVKSD